MATLIYEKCCSSFFPPFLPPDQKHRSSDVPKSEPLFFLMIDQDFGRQFRPLLKQAAFSSAKINFGPKPRLQGKKMKFFQISPKLILKTINDQL